MYKLWVQLEEQPENDSEEYRDASEPVCLGTFESDEEAERVMFALAAVLNPSGLTRSEVEGLTGTLRRAAI